MKTALVVDESPRWRGVVAEDDNQVTFEFQSPYVISATPTDVNRWGIYEPGCRNGLVLKGQAHCQVSVSTDNGAAWKSGVEREDERASSDISLEWQDEGLGTSGLHATGGCNEGQ